MKLWCPQGVREYPILLDQELGVLQDLECALVSASTPKAGESGHPPEYSLSSGMARLGLACVVCSIYASFSTRTVT